MTTHTPGPWFTKREGFSTVYVDARIGGGLLQEVASVGPQEGGIQQQDANARLIAAAPELLEALDSLMYWDNGKPEWEIARAAIAKATGKSE